MCKAVRVSVKDLGERRNPSDLEALHKQEVKARAVLGCLKSEGVTCHKDAFGKG